MLIEFVLALLLGALAGTFCGLAPGIHTNLVSVFLISSLPFLLSLFSPLAIIVFITSMAIINTFIDFIPSIFLGAPDEDTVLSILPGHQLLIEGRGYEAVILALFGSAAGGIFILLLVVPSIFILPIIYPYVKNIMPFILITASFFLIISEKQSKSWALIIFLLSGFLGIATLSLTINEPLLPLLTGLFGASSLITSSLKQQKIPEQKIQKIREIKKHLKNKSLFRSLAASLIASPLCCFLPGLGSGQAAVLGSEIIEDMNRKEFLILLGAINTIGMGFSFITFYVLQTTRTGTAVAISKVIPQLSQSNLSIILITILLSGIIASFLTIFLAKKFSKSISKFNYNKLSLGILVFLSIIILGFTGPIGFLVFLVSTSLGLTAIFTGIKRIHLMGCLLIPTILFYLL